MPDTPGTTEPKKHQIIDRTEMRSATLDLGTLKISLADYATTGIVSVGVGPRGCGKTNTGQLIAEQLSEQGWISVLFDPEEELEAMYGQAVQDEEELRERLTQRDRPIIVVRAANAAEFIPYGRVVLEVADELRKPIFVVVDEGQVFSAPRKRTESIGDAADILNEFAGRGRKRAIDLYITALSYTNSVHRSLFKTANLTFFGTQTDATSWSGLSQQFKAAGITFADLSSLGPAEFICVSRRGIDKVRVRMAEQLRKVAPAAQPVRRSLPANFTQWDRVVSAMPLERLQALTAPIVDLLSAVAGLSATKVAVGNAALQDEMATRVA